MTSKDKELIVTFRRCLGLKNKIGRKSRGGSSEKRYFVVQFGDKNFYEFLSRLGLKPAKSKILGALRIPRKYFADFLRGCIDGDGNINIQKHPESQYPQLRIRLSSASIIFLNWVKSEIAWQLKLKGGWSEKYQSVYVLNYGKSDSIKLLKFIYYDRVKHYLVRKYQRAKPFLHQI